ncbi:MAG: hypothetical protein IJJ47_05060 [Methanosphaera sp.]|nr:hypothetical protein [Methanosphaera sp.]
MKNKIFNPIFMFVIGATLGVASKLFDIHTKILGNIFSEFAIWILLGTIISIYSEDKKKAMINVFLFSIGMLITYYLTAHITHSVYGWTFIKGWTIFACISPIFAYFTWMTKEKGILPIIIRIGISGVSIFCSLFLFTVNIFDLIINLVLIYFLFLKK